MTRVAPVGCKRDVVVGLCSRLHPCAAWWPIEGYALLFWEKLCEPEMLPLWQKGDLFPSLVPNSGLNTWHPKFCFKGEQAVGPKHLYSSVRLGCSFPLLQLWCITFFSLSAIILSHFLSIESHFFSLFLKIPTGIAASSLKQKTPKSLNKWNCLAMDSRMDISSWYHQLTEIVKFRLLHESETHICLHQHYLQFLRYLYFDPSFFYNQKFFYSSAL